MESHAVAVTRQVSPLRVAVVAGGLIAGGAVAGAVAGALGASVWIAVTDGISAALSPQIWFYAGLVGAPFGAVLLPLAGFTALRRVPLGRLLATTILATALGGALGIMLAPSGWIVGAVTGFLLATGWLWNRSRRLAHD